MPGFESARLDAHATKWRQSRVTCFLKRDDDPWLHLSMADDALNLQSDVRRLGSGS